MDFNEVLLSKVSHLWRAVAKEHPLEVFHGLSHTRSNVIKVISYLAQLSLINFLAILIYPNICPIWLLLLSSSKAILVFHDIVYVVV